MPQYRHRYPSRSRTAARICGAMLRSGSRSDLGTTLVSPGGFISTTFLTTPTQAVFSQLRTAGESACRKSSSARVWFPFKCSSTAADMASQAAKISGIGSFMQRRISHSTSVVLPPRVIMLCCIKQGLGGSAMSLHERDMRPFRPDLPLCPCSSGNVSPRHRHRLG